MTRLVSTTRNGSAGDAASFQRTGPVYQDTPDDRRAAFERGRSILEQVLRGEPCPWHFDGRLLKDTATDRVRGVTLYSEPFDSDAGGV